MATLRLNRFTEWELSPLEYKTGVQYNELQIKVIQNEIARAAAEKVALTYDPLNTLAFAQREAELQGQIGILEFLLSQFETLNQSQSEGESQ